MNIINIEARPNGIKHTTLSIVVDESIEEVSKNVLKWRFSEHYLEIKRKTHKRSLDANSYYQVLLDKLAAALGTSRDELHEILLQRYGVTKVIDGKPVIISLRSDIDGHEVSRYVEPIGTGYVNGKEFTHWRILKGSSEMDSIEFSHLLDGLISECKESGIETLPEEEIRKMKEMMTNESNRKG